MAPTTPLTPSTPVKFDPKLHLPASTNPPSETFPAEQKVWLIFGATGHVGRSLVTAVLAHGDSVTAVGKTSESSMAQMQGWHKRCQGLLCDVRVRETVDAVLQKAIKHWSRVDVIVNCAGYGVIGACEDQDSCDLRSQFDTNFMGTLNILQLSLPYFRSRATAASGEADATTPTATAAAGRYIIFSSTSGALGVPGLGPYCATKYAVEGLVESMLYEVDAFGIKATLVEPGHMRLDEASGSGSDDGRLHKYGHFLVKKPSAPYDTPTAPAGHTRRLVQWLVDRQPTSVVKSAELVWQLGHCQYPPLRLLLGMYAVESVRDRLRSVIEEIEDWKHLSFQPIAEGRGRTDDNDVGGDKDENGHRNGESARRVKKEGGKNDHKHDDNDEEDDDGDDDDGRDDDGRDDDDDDDEGMDERGDAKMDEDGG